MADEADEVRRKELLAAVTGIHVVTWHGIVAGPTGSRGGKTRTGESSSGPSGRHFN
jgi:hypothetical protein